MIDVLQDEGQCTLLTALTVSCNFVVPSLFRRYSRKANGITVTSMLDRERKHIM
jgi:hypothetical protein